MKSVKTILVFVSAICFVFAIAGFAKVNAAEASSIPSFPMAFWGNITVDGSPAPVGTVVKAYYGNTLEGSTTVTESGIYGYNDPTKQKLLVAEGTGTITFKFQSSALNNNVESAGITPQTYSAFVADTTVNQNLVFITITATQVIPNSDGTATVNNTTPEVVVKSPTQPITVNITSGTTNPSVNYSSLVTGGSGVIPQTTIDSANAGNVSLVIPASTTVTSSDTSWNGVISAPTSANVTLPAVAGETKTLGTAIEVGFSGAKLSFDKAVRILFPGQSGKRAGYVRTGIDFTEITATCSADSQAVGNALATDGECKIDVGADMVIWTKHFTSFASFSSATVSVSSGGGGGGGGGGSAPVAVSPVVQKQATGQVLGAQTSGVHPNGTLIQDGQTIYLIKNGTKFGFRNPDEYKSYGYNFKQVVPANSLDTALPFDKANIIKALEGTLVLDGSDHKTVYMVGINGTKRGFASANTFKQLGYKFTNLPVINLSDYSSGSPVTSGSEAHPEGALVLDGKTIWWVRNGTRQGFESEAVFNTYGFSLSAVVKANASDLSLPQGPLIKFRDGTLVKENSTNYIISDGKALPFSSEAVMNRLGYQTTNAIAGALANYEKGLALQ